jgi:site-specific DNA recombinase
LLSRCAGHRGCRRNPEKPDDRVRRGFGFHLVENLLASVSQHQRQKNGEQTINRMRARTMNGYWCFAAPIGYRYKRVSGHGNMLVRDEPLSSIIHEALEGFAAGRFETQGEMKPFLESQPAYPKDFADGTIRFQRITDLLSRPVYAACVEARSGTSRAARVTMNP